MNSIFVGIDKDQFNLVSNCEVAKEACESLLKNVHEGTTSIKSSKLQILYTQFELLRMKEYKTIAVIIIKKKLYDVVNETPTLEYVFTQSQRVRKILHYLPY